MAKGNGCDPTPTGGSAEKYDAVGMIERLPKATPLSLVYQVNPLLIGTERRDIDKLAIGRSSCRSGQAGVERRAGLGRTDCWKVNFKTEVCANTPCSMLTMSWIKEGKVAKSTDGLLKLQSIEGRSDFPDFEMLDAKIASALKKIISNPHLRRRVTVEPVFTTDCLRDL